VKWKWPDKASTVWSDPVWSKVIASVITALGASVVLFVIASTRGCVWGDEVATAPEKPMAPAPEQPGAAPEAKDDVASDTTATAKGDEGSAPEAPAAPPEPGPQLKADDALRE
jgi:hypothetical protein